MWELLWALHGELGQMPRWAFLRNKSLLRGALIVLVPALDSVSLFGSRLFTTPQLVRLPKTHEERVPRATISELLPSALFFAITGARECPAPP